MEHQNKSKRAGTLSADGDAVGRNNQRVQDDDNIRQVRENSGLSSTAIMADRHPRHDGGGAAISERPSESGRDSTPPGTLGDFHDIRSEHIQAAHFQKHRGTGLPLSVNRENSSGEDSVRATRSVMTKQTTVAQISQKVPLKETNRAIVTFNNNYERLFEEFKAKLVDEYANMRSTYMNEFQMNYEENTSRSQDKVNEAQDSITNKGKEIEDLQSQQTKQQMLMQKFFNKRVHGALMMTTFRAWRDFVKFQLRKNRVSCYTTNSLRRSKMRKVFGGWRKWSHVHFMKRMQHDQEAYRAELESKMLVQWSGKVDHLLLYMAQLEEKIKLEQAAREKLAITYEQSLNQGQEKLRNETQLLAEDPLVKEISLIVAKQLMASGKAQQLISERSHDANLIEGVTNMMKQNQRNNENAGFMNNQ